MAPIKLTADDWRRMGKILLGVLALVCSGGVVAWAVSGRFAGFGVGLVAFPVVAAWAHERLRVRGRYLPVVGWGVCAAAGLLLRFFPVGILLAAAALVVDTRVNRRRILARLDKERALDVLAGKDPRRAAP